MARAILTISFRRVDTMIDLFVRCGGGDDTRRSGDRQAGTAATTGSYEAPVSERDRRRAHLARWARSHTNVSYLFATGSRVPGRRIFTHVGGDAGQHRRRGPGQTVSEPGGPRPAGPQSSPLGQGSCRPGSGISLISTAGQTVRRSSGRQGRLVRTSTDVPQLPSTKAATGRTGIVGSASTLATGIT